MVLASHCGGSYYRSVLCEEKRSPALSANAHVLCRAQKGYYKNKRHPSDMLISNSVPVYPICSPRSIRLSVGSRANPYNVSTVCVYAFIHVFDPLVRDVRSPYWTSLGLSVKPHQNQEDYPSYIMLAPRSIHGPGGAHGYSRKPLVTYPTLPLLLGGQLDCQCPRYNHWQALLRGFVRHQSKS